MATERIQDAQTLLAGGRWVFAYYVAGYAVECAMKSCVLAQMIHTGFVFTDKVEGKDFRVHDFGTLLKIAGLTDRLNADLKTSPVFAANWTTVKEWKETSRYQDGTTEAQARELIQAITQDPEGVLP
ncbi:MAG: hypothetical protein ACRC33_13730 [Gemmataceae bacterium]